LLTSKRDSPASEDEVNDPQTPPPYFASSPLDVDALPFSDGEKQPTIMCNACGESVKDAYLELANHIYHKEVKIIYENVKT
jgi:hypothetical protein